jgi:gamma-glutamylcyclotransferase (GGCT)/AIG2-like uncharacterized protein YtfP
VERGAVVKVFVYGLFIFNAPSDAQPATLPGRRLEFRRYANAAIDPQSNLRGLVIDVSDKRIKEMDWTEGVGRFYEREKGDAVLDDGTKVSVHFYAIPHERHDRFYRVIPDSYYGDAMRRAYRERGWIPDAIDSAWKDADADHQKEADADVAWEECGD